MKKKNLFKHYLALITMLFVVSGSFVSNVMAADVDYQVICSGNTVKLGRLIRRGKQYFSIECLNELFILQSGRR